MRTLLFIRRNRSRAFALGVALAVLTVGSVVAGLRLISSESKGPPANEARYLAAVHSLKSGYGITIADVEPTRTPRVSRTRALRVAVAESSFLGGKSPSAHLVYYTDRSAGTQTSDADGAAIIPLAEHRLTWLVLSWHAQAPIFCCPGRKGPASYAAGVATFVDASTGKVIQTSTIDDWP